MMCLGTSAVARRTAVTRRIRVRPVISASWGLAWTSLAQERNLSRYRRPVNKNASSALLSCELHPVLQQLLVAIGIDVVLGADHLLQPGPFPQHETRRQRPRLGKDVRIFHRDFVIDPILVDARIALGDVQRIGMKRPRA